MTDEKNSVEASTCCLCGAQIPVELRECPPCYFDRRRPPTDRALVVGFSIFVVVQLWLLGMMVAAP
jgi:hypothetical protein